MGAFLFQLKGGLKETLQAIKNYVLGKAVFELFDMGIEKVKGEIGKTAQEIHLSKIPTYKELVSSLPPMLNNRLSPKQIYINPIMRNAVNSLSDEAILEAKDKQAVNGLEFYSMPAVAPNTMYVLPDPDLVGVMAIPRFGILPYSDIVCLENYADFPSDIKEDTLLRLTNIEAPYKITVPQRWIDDYQGITI
ncbi:MAG: hypothetical protein IIT65_06775 [Lachnospiraceae bacterium]|nr:hypothetical protein [Lachnospiraceae bacterium]